MSLQNIKKRIIQLSPIVLVTCYIVGKYVFDNQVINYIKAYDKLVLNTNTISKYYQLKPPHFY